MLSRIQRFLYDHGVRPIQNSIYFSPSLAMTLAAQSWSEAFEHFEEGQREKEKIMRYNSRHSQGADAEGIQQLPVDVDRRDDFFVRFSFCPMCGSKLGLTGQGSKICPRLHGQTSFDMVADDAETLPTVTFELFE